MTNSDRIHGEQVQAQLGFRLSHWFCAEDARVYKPAPQFWHFVAGKLGVELNKSWWHVSAYGDYDLRVTRELGLTNVFIERPHAREGVSDLRFADLSALARYVEEL
jgi:FMN phosphatase YigB (HAD superfamily)